MPRRFFRKFTINRHDLAERWFMRPFRRLLHDNQYWAITRRTVVPAFALGLFIAFLPLPGHPIVAALLAIALRINIPVAILTTFVSNPLTMGPMYFFAYRLGAEILNIGLESVAFEMSLDWLTQTFVTIWQPMLLGSLILAIAASLTGYVVLDLLWRTSVGRYKTGKRSKRLDRNS